MLDDLQAFCEAATKDHPQIRVSQIRFLVAVAQYSPQGITMTALANEMGVTLAAISRAVDVFGTAGRRDKEGKGYVRVILDFNDDRTRTLQITDAGLDYLLGLTAPS